MTTVTIHEAEIQLDDLIARAEAGEEILIARDNQPIAKLKALPHAESPRAKRRVFGSLEGIYSMPPDSFFFDPLPDDELAAWEGGSDEDDPAAPGTQCRQDSTKDKP